MPSARPPKQRSPSSAASRGASSCAAADGVRVYDDYAHNPAKVDAAIAAARELEPRRVLVLFQPHLYSRTRHLAFELGRALSAADAVAVTEIYAAREEPIEGVTGRLVVEAAARRPAGDAARLDADARGRRALRVAPGRGRATSS